MNQRDFLVHHAADPMTVLHQKMSDHEDITKPIPEKISREDALIDLACFRNIMEEGYSGYTYYEKKQFDDAFSAMEKRITSGSDEIAPLDLLNIIAEELSFISDGHLSLNAGNVKIRFFKKEMAYVSDARLREENGKYICTKCGKTIEFDESVTLFPTLPDENGPLYMIGVRSKEEVASIKVKADGEEIELPLHMIASEPIPEKKPTAMLIEKYYDDVAVITCTTFVGNTDKYLESFYRAGLRCRTCNHVIFNLVNNGGGNSVFPQRFFDGLYGWVGFSSKGGRIYDSSLLRAKRFGNIEEGVERTYSEWHNVKNEDEPTPENMYNGSLHVVINQKVASSAELAVCMASNVEGVKYYGCNSAGVGKYGDVLTWFLPKSCTIIRAPYKIFDNGIEETIGYTPDLWVDSTDPVGAVIEYVRGLKK